MRLEDLTRSVYYVTNVTQRVQRFCILEALLVLRCLVFRVDLGVGKKETMKTHCSQAVITSKCITEPGRLLLAISSLLRGATSLALGLSLFSSVTSTFAQGRTPAEVSNTDIKYPCFLDQASGQKFYPDDVEIVCYGPELKKEDVIWTWDTSNPLYEIRLNWGTPDVSVVENFVDPQNPAYPGNGMNCLTIRWHGPIRPELGPPTGPGLGQFVHVGAHFKPSAGIVHCEIWWTRDGVRVANVCDPKLTFICSTSTITVCVENPYSVPIYVYGCRFFQPATTKLPRLSDLVTHIQPQAFGADGWTVAPTPASVIRLDPWCRIYVKLPGRTTWSPVVFQLASSFTRDITPAFDGGPNPEDPFTAAIRTTRSGVIRQADADGDGIVGIRDYQALQREYRRPNPDLVP